MTVIGKAALDKFVRKHNDARKQISAWLCEAEEAEWNNSLDIKAAFPKASIISAELAVFDIVGNDYRLLVKINYRYRLVKVLKVGTHKEYDKWHIK